MTEQKTAQHNLILDCRKKLSLSGVKDVSGFNEEIVNLDTNLGGLVIRGSQLHISKLNLDTGDVEVEGKVNSLQYFQGKEQKSLFQRIFK
ncbi:MAG: sporulation protein YabP [Oscillospiraceae bacterium]|nr:sporulation protein YabP [Oscillospiraceae bacterium]